MLGRAQDASAASFSPVSEEEGARQGADSRRAALYAAGVLLAGLAAVVAVVALSGGEGGGNASAADPACLEAWNSDETAVGFGQHQFGGHGYERVQVLRVDGSGTPTEGEDGMCGVVFAATELDPEPGARAQVLLDGSWTGFESLRGVNDRAIGQLQSDAVAGTNATLTSDGRLIAQEG
jgi:hypothetical protein